MNPSTTKRRWAIIGTAAVLGIAGTGTAVALNDQAPRAESSEAVTLSSGDSTSDDGVVGQDDSPESADSPNESAQDTPGSAESADSPGDANHDPSPESADSPNESAQESADSGQSANSANSANDSADD